MNDQDQTQEAIQPRDVDAGQRPTSKVGKGLVLGIVAALAGFLIWFLAFNVEWGGGSSFPLGTPFKGRTLTVSLEKINRVSEVRYAGTDGSHVLVTPSDPANELLTLQLNVHNSEATVAILNMEGQAVQVRDANSDERYPMLDVRTSNTENVQIVPEGRPSEEQRYRNGFLIGIIELPQGNSLLGGWVVVEVPEGAEVDQVRWGAGDVIFFESE